MAEHSTIEWTEATWNPITGCLIHSPGCANCYAMKLAGTRLRNHPSRAGLTKPSKNGPVWTGETRFNEQWIRQPLQWSRPRMIFVVAHGDLFYEEVPDEWIDLVFAVMALARHHTFQVLTKRSARMRAYLREFGPERKNNDRMLAIDGLVDQLCADTKRDRHEISGWPLSNVWIGVSAERQQEADERIPDLLASPAAVRWVSLEPLLGPIDLTSILRKGASGDDWTYVDNALTGFRAHKSGGSYGAKLDWVVVGGESQIGSRPMHPIWPRALHKQCEAADVPFLFKQWGDFHPSIEHDPEWCVQHGGSDTPDAIHIDGRREYRPSEAFRLIGESKIGRNGWAGVCRVGVKNAGRLLDGVEHNGMPRGAV